MSEPTQLPAWATEKAEEISSRYGGGRYRDANGDMQKDITAALVEAQQKAHGVVRCAHCGFTGSDDLTLEQSRMAAIEHVQTCPNNPLIQRVKEVERERDEARAGLIDKYPDAYALHAWHQMRKERDTWIEVANARQNQLETAEARVKEVERERDEAIFQLRQMTIWKNENNETANTFMAQVKKLQAQCEVRQQVIQTLEGKHTAATGLLRECEDVLGRVHFVGTLHECKQVKNKIAAFLASQSVKEPETPGTIAAREARAACNNLTAEERQKLTREGTEIINGPMLETGGPTDPKFAQPKDAQARTRGEEIDLNKVGPIPACPHGNQINHCDKCALEQAWSRCETLESKLDQQSAALRACVEALKSTESVLEWVYQKASFIPRLEDGTLPDEILSRCRVNNLNALELARKLL